MKNCRPQEKGSFKYIDIDAIDNKNQIIKDIKILQTSEAPSRAIRCTKKGDILFSMVRPYLKNIALVTDDNCIASSGFFVCSIPKPISSKYCYYFMISSYVVNGLNQFIKGDNSPSINTKNIMEWLYPLPPLAEQQRIVKEVEKWFAVIDQLEKDKIDLAQAIKQAKNKILDLAIRGKLLAQDPNDEPAEKLLKRINPNWTPMGNSHYQKMPFELPKGWVLCRLDDIALYKKGPFGSSLTKSMFVPKASNNYKVYEQKNAIQKNENIGEYYITKEKYESLRGFAIKPFDIIVSCAGTIGETYILSENAPAGIINQALMLIRLFDRNIEDFYLIYFDFILKIEAYKESKGTAVKNIPPLDVLKNFNFPLPPLAEQQRIVEKIEILFTELDNIQHHLK